MWGWKRVARERKLEKEENCCFAFDKSETAESEKICNLDLKFFFSVPFFDTREASVLGRRKKN